LRPDVTITPHPEDATQQVITFDPPVASWSFDPAHPSDELWLALRQATSHLMFTHKDEAFTEDMQKQLKARILTVLLYWVSQKWLTLPQ